MDAPATNDALQTAIDAAWEARDKVSPATRGEVRDAVEAALDGLDAGAFRVAEKTDGRWRVNQWLKKAVLLSFRLYDNAMGIPLEDIPHVFERFFRASGVDVQAGAGVGLGLGLHITHSIVERHGGQIEARSSLGKGSTFIVTLPLLEAHGDENGAVT